MTEDAIVIFPFQTNYHNENVKRFSLYSLTKRQTKKCFVSKQKIKSISNCQWSTRSVLESTFEQK